MPDWPNGFSRGEEPEGSGIVVGDGRIIATSDHVLGPAKSARIRTLDGRVIAAEIALRNAATDIAILTIAKQLTSFELETTAKVGAKACAIGNAFGLDISLSCGVVSSTDVSGTGFNRIENFIQTDAPVNPGMSGGALVNESGQLIGMLSAIFTKQSDANVGVNFAVSAELLSRVFKEYQSGGKLSLLKAGLVLRTKPNDGRLGLIGQQVNRVIDGSPEQQAGIKVGDILLTANEDHRLKRKGSYQAAVALMNEGDVLKLRLLRSGKPMTIHIQF